VLEEIEVMEVLEDIEIMEDIEVIEGIEVMEEMEEIEVIEVREELVVSELALKKIMFIKAKQSLPLQIKTDCFGRISKRLTRNDLRQSKLCDYKEKGKASFATTNKAGKQ